MMDAETFAQQVRVLAAQSHGCHVCIMPPLCALLGTYAKTLAQRGLRGEALYTALLTTMQAVCVPTP